MNNLQRPDRPWMAQLAKHFSSSFSGKVNFLLGTSGQWKAALWFQQGLAVSFDYHQQQGLAALFNFIYDFGELLNNPSVTPSAHGRWVAEPELFTGIPCWAWPWATFVERWEEQEKKAWALAQKAPRPEYLLRLTSPVTIGEMPLSPMAQEIIQALQTTPQVQDLYALDKWAAGDLTGQLVDLKKRGLLKAFVAAATSSC